MAIGFRIDESQILETYGLNLEWEALQWPFRSGVPMSLGILSAESLRSLAQTSFDLPR